MLTSGLDPREFDHNIRPQDDLFGYVNALWIAQTPIPNDQVGWGSFFSLQRDAESAVHDILKECVNANDGERAQRQLGDLYRSFMDIDAVNARGSAALQPLFESVAQTKNMVDVMTLIGQWTREGLCAVIAVFASGDFSDPQRNIALLEQAGLSLPDESYYRDDQFSTVRQEFLTHVERMFALVNLDDAAARAARVVSLETAIASHHWDATRCRDNDQTSNLMKFEEVVTMSGPPEQHELLRSWALGMAAGNALSEVVVRQPSFLEGVVALSSPDRLSEWRDWLAWHAISALAPYLSDEIAETNFDFFGRTLTGTPQRRERWQRATSFANSAMGDAVGQLYVERFYPESARHEMDLLVSSLIEAYRCSITELAWMGATTRERALAKLELLGARIGFPQSWTSYDDIETSPTDLIANVVATQRSAFRRELAKCLRRVDREEWMMTPQTINAYYYPAYNQVVFPAAILQPPFFDPARDPATNFGAIGSIIGHEIGHAFDDQGSKFDGNGLKTQWWEQSDREEFELRAQALIEQFEGLRPRATPELSVNGALTVGENIGDLGGVAIAWRAYEIYLDGEEAPYIDGLSGVQRFFLSYARNWRLVYRTEIAHQLIVGDPHSPAEFRCNQIVRNVDAFYEAFEVTEGDALFLAPEQRISIWS